MVVYLASYVHIAAVSYHHMIACILFSGFQQVRLGSEYLRIRIMILNMLSFIN